MLLQYVASSTGSAVSNIDAEQIKKRIAAAAPDKFSEEGQALLAGLVSLNNSSINTRTRLKLLQQIDQRVEQILSPVEQDLSAAALPLSAARQVQASVASSLLKELASGYGVAIDKLTKTWLPAVNGVQLHQTTARAMETWARRLRLAYRVYANSSRTSWGELHMLYRLAHRLGFAHKAAKNASATPEMIYMNALLLAFAEPSKLMPGHIDWVSNYIDRFSYLVELKLAKSADRRAALFIVQTNRDRPGRSLAKWPTTSVAQGDWLLNCEQLVAKLTYQVRTLNQGKAPHELDLPNDANKPQYVELLQQLANYWNATPARRYSRVLFHPRVELVAGLDAVWHYLSGPAFEERISQTLWSSKQNNSSEWVINNESPAGFAFRYSSGAVEHIRVGEIIAFRVKDRSGVSLGVVRRVLSPNMQQLEIGVEELAPRAMPVYVEWCDEQGMVHKSRALYFAKMPILQNSPALLAITGTVKEKQTYSISHSQGQFRTQIAMLVESLISLELYRLLPPRTVEMH